MTDKKRILVVDDEHLTQTFIKRTFDRAGYETEVASDGEEAVKMLNSGPFDLVLLDQMMPKLDGIETLKLVRKNPELKDLPIIMLTGKGTAATVRDAIKLGIDDFVVKPFDPVDSLSRLETHFFRPDANRVRMWLSTLNIPDPSGLGSKKQVELEVGNYRSYPIRVKGLKLVAAINGGAKPQSLSKSEINIIAEKVIIYSKPGFIWKKIWPDNSVSSGQSNEIKESLNQPEDWLSEVDEGGGE